MFSSTTALIIPINVNFDTTNANTLSYFEGETTTMISSDSQNIKSNATTNLIDDTQSAKSTTKYVSIKSALTTDTLQTYTQLDEARINVGVLKIFDNYSNIARKSSSSSTQALSNIQTNSYSKTFVYNSNFPDFCDEGGSENPNLDKLVDKTDNNLIAVGSEIRHVVYGLYYNNIYQFDKKFITTLGTDFRIYGLSESLVFDNVTYTLKGNIQFTNSKDIKFVINDTYKFNLTLIVDVREEFVE